MEKDKMSRDALIKICFTSNTGCKLIKQKQVGLLNISIQEYTKAYEEMVYKAYSQTAISQF